MNGDAKHSRCRYTREEVFQHSTKEDCWIVLHGEVYDVTSWINKHPGGAQLLLNHAGEDASVRQLHADWIDTPSNMRSLHTLSAQQSQVD